LIGILYIFNALVILSQEYYTESIDALEKAFNFSKDVSTSTLLSFGGSTPELCISIMAIFADSNIAFGTILGSSVFNTLMLTGIASMFGRKDKIVNWFPIIRDILFTIVAISILILIIYFSIIDC